MVIPIDASISTGFNIVAMTVQHLQVRTLLTTTTISGQITENFQYSPYGLLLSGDASKTPFLFNGMYGVMTDSNNLYYMRARFYSPDIRRFVNRDVLLGDVLLGDVVSGQTLNRYVFVTGRPVSFVDPFGLNALTTAEIWLRGIGGAACVIPIPGARVAGMSIIMLSLSGDTLKTQALPGEGLVPPGDCNQGYYNFLKSHKDFIYNQPRACSPMRVESCSDILINLHLNNACVKARDDLMKQCFKGGNKVHQKQKADTRTSVFKCIAQAARNSCPNF
ncbi:MAG: RHS repeat-associated core domain-containing protein [Candidatus Marithrix sp.]